MFVEILNPF